MNSIEQIVVTRLPRGRLARSETILAIVAVGLLASGCRPAQTPARVKEVEVEHLQEVAAVLAQLGQKAYVFKHQGGEVTAAFTLYHQPAGTNQQERVIFQANGDEAVRLRHGGTSGPGKGDDPTGYLIVAVPKRVFATGESDLIFRFNLGKASCGKAAKVAHVYAGTALSPYPRVLRAGESGDELTAPGETNGVVLDLYTMQYREKWALSPGETITLVEHAWWHGAPTDELYLKQAKEQSHVVARQLGLEKFRSVLTITALKNGQLPNRDNGK